MRTDPNPGERCVGIHKVGFPFSNSDKNLIPTLQSAEASDCVIPRAKRFSFINFDRSLTVKISIK